MPLCLPLEYGVNHSGAGSKDTFKKKWFRNGRPQVISGLNILIIQVFFVLISFHILT